MTRYVTSDRGRPKHRYGNVNDKYHTNYRDNVDGIATQIFTLDTCVILRIIEGERSLVTYLKTRCRITGSEILFNSTIVRELEKRKIARESAEKKLRKSFDARIGFIEDPKHVHTEYLKNRYPTIHRGDDMILMCAKESKSVLITCDRKLALTAPNAGVRVINPDGPKKIVQRRSQNKKKSRQSGVKQYENIVLKEQRWQKQKNRVSTI